MNPKVEDRYRRELLSGHTTIADWSQKYIARHRQQLSADDVQTLISHASIAAVAAACRASADYFGLPDTEADTQFLTDLSRRIAKTIGHEIADYRLRTYGR